MKVTKQERDIILLLIWVRWKANELTRHQLKHYIQILSGPAPDDIYKALQDEIAKLTGVKHEKRIT